MNNERIAEKIKDFADELLTESVTDIKDGIRSLDPNHPAIADSMDTTIDPTLRVLAVLSRAALAGSYAAEELAVMCEDFQVLLMFELLKRNDKSLTDVGDRQ